MRKVKPPSVSTLGSVAAFVRRPGIGCSKLAGACGVNALRARFHQWELDLDSGELACDGQPLRLQPQPARVLSLLCRRAGSLVTREEIQRELWHMQSQVDFDQGLNYCVRQIRLVLKDNAQDPIYIETVPQARIPVPSNGPRSPRMSSRQSVASSRRGSSANCFRHGCGGFSNASQTLALSSGMDRTRRRGLSFGAYDRTSAANSTR